MSSSLPGEESSRRVKPCTASSAAATWLRSGAATQCVSQSVVFVELHARPGTVAVVLTDLTVHIQPGDHIKNTPR
jgi:hypothetical protein